MKTIIQTTLAVSLAVAFAAPVSANELDVHDPVAASFQRDLDREPNTRISRNTGERDQLPGMIRTALDGHDPVVASFERNLNYTPTPTGKFLMPGVEQDCLPGLVRAALDDEPNSRGDATLAQRQ